MKHTEEGTNSTHRRVRESPIEVKEKSTQRGKGITLDPCRCWSL